MGEQGSENQEYSVGLDIGTTKIVAIVGRKNKFGKIELMGVGKSKSLGVNNGVVSNIVQTVNSIKEAVEMAEKSAKVPIKKVTVGIAGKHIRSFRRKDSIIRDNPDAFITEEDIECLKNKINSLVMQPGEEVIQVLPQEYEVDSETGIIEPIGMYGTNLGAEFHVIVGQMGPIKNIARCVREAGLEMEGLTLEPLASAEAVLHSDEKEAGVALIDIGGGTTDIAIFKNEIIRHTCVIPYGGNIITDDVKDACSIIEKQAEKLKVKFGSALPERESENVIITIPGMHGRPDKEISSKTLASVINARMKEILDFVDKELKRYGVYEPKKKLIAGIVLTGGGANLKHLRQLTHHITGLETRIGIANEYIVNDKKDQLKSAEYATAIGLLMESLEYNERKPKEEPESIEPILPDPTGGNEGEGGGKEDEGQGGGNNQGKGKSEKENKSWRGDWYENLKKKLIDFWDDNEKDF